MTALELIKQIETRDIQKIRGATWEIITRKAERDLILQLVPFISNIQNAIHDLEMGGAFAPNKRFVDYALRVIEHHRDKNTCPCILNMQMECINPKEEEKRGNARFYAETVMDGVYVDYYSVECVHCNQKFKVIEREYHYTWWGWSPA